MDKNEIIETLRANRTLLEQYHVRSLSVFGSIVRGEAGPERDVDILVEFDPGAKVGLFAFARLQRCLQDLLGRQVDLTTQKALHEALKKDLSQEELLKLPVYIAHRPQKDPRDLRVLDPACGSGRFLLYAFDEYWDDQAVAAASRRCSRIGASEIQSRDDSATVHFFNQDEPIANLAGDLPHWRQESVTYFVTFRLFDSLPQSKLKQWQEEKESWITAHPEPLNRDEKKEFYRLFPERIQTWLDAGHGSCILSRPDLKKLVADAMLHFNGDRYHLDEYVVMPNHVHVVVTPVAGNELSSILHSWKSYTSHKINNLLGRSGENWQKESFDHIVRSERSLNKFREYIKRHSGSVAAASRRWNSVKSAAGRRCHYAIIIQISPRSFEQQTVAIRRYRESADPRQER